MKNETKLKDEINLVYNALKNAEQETILHIEILEDAKASIQKTLLEYTALIKDAKDTLDSYRFQLDELQSRLDNL